MLMRFDPFREIDRMSEEAFRPVRSSWMPMDAYRRGDVFVVHFDLPGVDPDNDRPDRRTEHPDGDRRAKSGPP